MKSLKKPENIVKWKFPPAIPHGGKNKGNFMQVEEFIEQMKIELPQSAEKPEAKKFLAIVTVAEFSAFLEMAKKAFPEMPLDDD